MARSYPPDVILLDTDGLLHARVARGRKSPRILQAKSFASRGPLFGTGVVTPELTDEAGLAELLRRLKSETGRWDTATLLLPDSWFRMNLIELPSLPDRPQEAMHAVRWSLKRTLPIPPDTLRMSWEVLARSATGVRLLAVSAVEVTLAAIERVFRAAGIEVAVIEPVGLNIWNAITAREASTAADRIFVYLRDQDFTTAVFRGSEPLFIRSRNLSGERSVQQEIRLSATYLRDTLANLGVERCWVAGDGAADEARAALSAEFGAPVAAVSLADFTEQIPSNITGHDAELTACTGVFTG